MKRAAFPLLLLICFLFLAAFGPPFLRIEAEIFVDDAPLDGKNLLVEVPHALRAERSGGYEKLYDTLLKKYSPQEALNYLAIHLGDYLLKECEKRRVEPVNATLEWKGDVSAPFLYHAEKTGRVVDLAALGREVARAMDQKDGRARARVYTHEVAPDVTVAKLKAITRETARFSTSFASSGANRRHNLTLAAKAISGTVLLPNETFSFNKVVGERTAQRGFLEANVVINGEFQKGIGGGVCQVSTTLFNAVLLAALPVENAAAHSIPVSYVPFSQDCTVSSAIDFRFTNDTDHPVYIAATVKGSTLTFVLYGQKKGVPCHLESEVVKHIPFRNLYEDGTEVKDPTAATLLSAGREGILSRLYRVRGNERTLLRENRYAAKDAIYKKLCFVN